MNEESWYRTLNKPNWAPDEKLFGQVWTIIYPIIIAANIYVIVLLIQRKISFLVALPFWLNIVFNAIFTPIQFGLKNNALAFVDIVLVLATIIWAMIAIKPYSQIVMYAFVPYLLWVGFATILQFSILIKN